jgi:asparagine N-glycosylation enzyme membrane subunit Stt3
MQRLLQQLLALSIAGAESQSNTRSNHSEEGGNIEFYLAIMSGFSRLYNEEDHTKVASSVISTLLQMYIISSLASLSFFFSLSFSFSFSFVYICVLIVIEMQFLVLKNIDSNKIN